MNDQLQSAKNPTNNTIKKQLNDTESLEEGDLKLALGLLTLFYIYMVMVMTSHALSFTDLALHEYPLPELNLYSPQLLTWPPQRYLTTEIVTKRRYAFIGPESPQGFLKKMHEIGDPFILEPT